VAISPDNIAVGDAVGSRACDDRRVATWDNVGEGNSARTNGLISYRVYFDPDHSTDALFVANPTPTARI
jgi:hypothetical protein